LTTACSSTTLTWVKFLGKLVDLSAKLLFHKHLSQIQVEKTVLYSGAPAV
jgi:hypothetical protein